MKTIKFKNYIILTILIIATVLITLMLSNLYLNKSKGVSDFYNYLNSITADEFSQYIIEKTDTIIYISNKNNLENKNFELKFKNKIEKLNIKDKIVFLDKTTINKSFLDKLEKDYKINLDLDKGPIVLTILDKKIKDVIYVNKNTEVDSFINYEVFE